MKEFFNKIEAVFTSRILLIVVIFGIMFSLLVVKILSIQVKATEKEDPVTDTKIFKLRDIKATRGNIYDVNGKLLAYNVMSYSVVMEDSGQLSGNAARNTMIYSLLNIFRKYNTKLEIPAFGLALDENGEIIFTLSDTALLRFKKNAYGLRSINDLDEEQRNSTPEDVFNFLRYGTESTVTFQISDEYTLEEAIDIMAIRYMIFSNTAGTQFTIATNISDELAVAVMENGAALPGVEVQQVTSRVYNYSEYMGHILGYTGAITTEEIESLNNQIIKNENLTTEEETNEKGTSLLYNASDVVGKTGIEKSMEDVLSGTKGTKYLTVNSAGKILSQTANTDPTAGNDVYLSIDADLQKACYYILEKNLAAILLSKINPNMDYGQKGTNAQQMKIPIYEVYYALIDNEIIDVDHFFEEDATALEKRIGTLYENYKNKIINQLNTLLSIDNKKLTANTTSEQQEYLQFIYDKAVSAGLLVTADIDMNDDVYKKYHNGEISMSEFFKYSITQNWINTSSFSTTGDYYSISELYELFIEKLIGLAEKDNSFKEKIYRTLIFNYTISGRDICLLLYDQNVLEYDSKQYTQLSNGSVSAYSFMRNQIYYLNITPGMLGLYPCSGSIVISDVNTGSVLALVSYPGYDNNRLANKIDYDYYTSLTALNSYPLINRPALQTTTTGSLFKPLSALMGLSEGVITQYTRIYDSMVFEEINPSPKCWRYPWSHGSINLTDAIMHSCNYFFYKVGYSISMQNGVYSDAKGIQTIQKYAKMFGLGEKTGIEISEAMPYISNSDAVRTAIGYGHTFSPVQISRYITAIANEGRVYKYTLIDSVHEHNGDTLYKQESELINDIHSNWSQAQWDAVQLGMYKVVNTNTYSFDQLFSNVSVKVAGKTGTAQVSNYIPSHTLFASYAPYNNPKISVTVVLPNGYQSANAANVVRDVYAFYFDGENAEDYLSGNITAGTATNITVSD